jgi:hypothetical protein
MFIVNAAEWDFVGMSADDIERLIDRALDFVEISSHRGEEVMIGDDFQTRPMQGALTLWDLFSEGAPLHMSREIAQELAVWLGRARHYADVDDWPVGFEDSVISINGSPSTQNEDVAWVHYCVRASRPAACVTLGSSRVLETATITGRVDLHFVGEDHGRKRFWQAVIILEGDDLNSLARHASRAYPNLYFVGSVIAHANHLSGGYLASRQRVCNALAVLDDLGHWAFTCPPPALAPGEPLPFNLDARPSNQLIEHRFAGIGLDAAPEKPNVRGHRASREARETVLDGRTLYCEWHVKLQPDRNRIYFHPPIPESGDRVVIGMIHEHLPLP